MAAPFILAIVATPFVFVGWILNRVFEHRLRVKQIEAGARALPQLPAAASPAADVEQRLANLEAIICDLDYDLAQRVRAAAASTRAA